MLSTCYPITKPVRSAVPTFEPVTVDEAKVQCDLSVQIDGHNEELLRLIGTAREQVERDAMLVCATGTFTWKMTDWGDDRYFELASGLYPVSSLTSIVYTATDGTSTTWSASQYTFDNTTIRPIVRLNYGYVWPVLRHDINGITITAVAGYASQSVIPNRVKHAVLLLVRHWYRNKDIVGQVGPEIARSYESIIEGLRPEVYG